MFTGMYKTFTIKVTDAAPQGTGTEFDVVSVLFLFADFDLRRQSSIIRLYNEKRID